MWRRQGVLYGSGGLVCLQSDRATRAAAAPGTGVATSRSARVGESIPTDESERRQ